MGKLTLSWDDDEIGFVHLPLEVHPRERRLLVLGTFNAPQFAPAVVIVAFPLPEGQEKAMIDLSKPVVEIVRPEVLAERVVAQVQRRHLNWKGFDGVGPIQDGPMGPKKRRSLQIAFQGSKHSGMAWLDSSKGVGEVRFQVSDANHTELEFCLRREVDTKGKPVRFTLQSSGELAARLLWEGATSQEGACLSFIGPVRQETIRESATELEKLRALLYRYEENSWRWVLLALLLTLTETSNLPEPYLLKIEIIYPPRVVELPHGFSQSFFGPALPMALGKSHPSKSVTRKSPKESPTIINELVSFAVKAPPLVTPGKTFLVEVWAYKQEQRDEMLRRAHEATQGVKIALREKGPLEIARGTVISVHLRISDLQVESPEDTLLWKGEIATASFVVTVPQKTAFGEKPGILTFSAGGLPIARLNFIIILSQESVLPDSIPLEVKPYRTAFASYASVDRDDVLAVVQGMQKIYSKLDVFLDVLSLRSGQRWEQELWQEIPKRDIFYLFWSQAARKSEWVEKEWRCALEKRGLDFIDPVPLVSPHRVPPPQELGALHFNDWVLAFKRRRTAARKK